MKDKYDEAVEYLTKHPNEIFDAWCSPYDREGGILFGPASPHPEKGQPFPVTQEVVQCGCLTQVRARAWREFERMVAWTEDLTKRIAADKRIPNEPGEITVKNLRVFAKWQRILDKELNRV